MKFAEVFDAGQHHFPPFLQAGAAVVSGRYLAALREAIGRKNLPPIIPKKKGPAAEAAA